MSIASGCNKRQRAHEHIDPSKWRTGEHIFYYMYESVLVWMHYHAMNKFAQTYCCGTRKYNIISKCEFPRKISRVRTCLVVTALYCNVCTAGHIIGIVYYYIKSKSIRLLLHEVLLLIVIRVRDIKLLHWYTMQNITSGDGSSPASLLY